MSGTHTEAEARATAVIDQSLAASADAEQRWPYNESVQCDERIELRLLDAMIGPDSVTAWDPMPTGIVHLCWPVSGKVHPAPPGTDLAALARDTYPNITEASCDRCAVQAPIYGALLCAFSAKVIGLSICGTCAYDLATAGYQPVWTFRPGQHDKEIHDAD